MIHVTTRLVQHRFGFRDSCVLVEEETPVLLAPNSRHHHPRLPTVFFLHGRFGQRQIWALVTEKLRTRYRFVTVELPGFGSSFVAGNRKFSLCDHVELLAQLIQHFGGNGPVIVVGHDLGGAIAQLCAMGADALIDGLVLLNTVCVTDAFTRRFRKLLGLHTRWSLRRLLRAAPELAQEIRDAISEPWSRRTSRAAMLDSIRGIEESWPSEDQRNEWRETLCGLWCPTLILWGGRDSVNSREHGEELLRDLPNASFFVNDRCGHWPCLEDAGWVSGKLRDFVSQVQLEREISRVRRFPLR